MNQWQDATDEIVKSLPYEVAEWLLEFGSLTEKLENVTGTSVKLEVLNESTEAANSKECELLGISDGSKIWSREVLLFGKSAPWIYAKTIVPSSSAFLIQELGNKPLGSILFSEKELARQMLKIRKLAKEHHLYQCAKVNSPNVSEDIMKALWARRSLWQNSKQPERALLVSEVFLPNSPLYKN